MASSRRPPAITRASASGRAATGLTRATWPSMKRNIARWSVKSRIAECSRMTSSFPVTAAFSEDEAVHPMCSSIASA